MLSIGLTLQAGTVVGWGKANETFSKTLKNPVPGIVSGVMVTLLVVAAMVASFVYRDKLKTILTRPDTK